MISVKGVFESKYLLSSASCVPYCVKLLGTLSHDFSKTHFTGEKNGAFISAKITQLLSGRFQTSISNFRDMCLTFVSNTFLVNNNYHLLSSYKIPSTLLGILHIMITLFWGGSIL